MSMMDITCKRCGARILADDVNLQTLAAKCQSCNAVFSIADQVAPAESLTPRSQLDVPLPERFIVDYPAEALRIQWRWFRLTAIFLAIFAVFWNGFVCVWIWMVLSAGAGPFALFATIHALAGLGVAYSALSMFLNTTTVEASYGMLSVRHQPLPAFSNHDLPRDSLRQLYGMERVSRSRNGTSVTYELYALKADGSSTALIKGLECVEQALYLEQEIERFMGITDESVRGELRK